MHNYSTSDYLQVIPVFNLILIGLLFAICLVLSYFLLKYYKLSKRYKLELSKLEITYNESKERLKEVDNLETTIKKLHCKLKVWLNLYKLILTVFQKGGQFSGINRVSDGPLYSEEKQHSNHLGSVDNLFDPVPEKPTKLFTGLHRKKKVLIFDNITIGSRSNCLVVFDPLNTNSSNPVINDNTAMALIAYTTGSEYSIDIFNGIDQSFQTISKDRFSRNPLTSRGANRIGMDYLIKRAKREKAEKITGTVIPPINESHRARLYYFYIDKYKFKFEPATRNIELTKLRFFLHKDQGN